MKYYKNLLEEIFSFVEEETELSRQDILTSRREECVNARMAIIAELTDVGLSECEIARLLGFSQQKTNHSRNTQEGRLRSSPSFRILVSRIKEFTIKSKANKNLSTNKH